MSPATFFRLALVIPLALPLLTLAFRTNSVTVVMELSLALGGLQYLVFAIWLFFVIGRTKTSKQVQKLSAMAPLLFVPVQAMGWFAVSYSERLSNPELGGIWEPIIPFAVYTVVIGYVYVGIVNAAFEVCKRLGVVKEHPIHPLDAQRRSGRGDN